MRNIHISFVHTTRFGRNLRVIHNRDVIIRNSIAIWEFKPHLKFLVNHVCFHNIQASSVVLGGFLDHVNKTKSTSTIFERLRFLLGGLLDNVNKTKKWLQTQDRHSYHSRNAFESLVWTGLLHLQIFTVWSYKPSEHSPLGSLFVLAKKKRQKIPDLNFWLILI